MSASEATAPPSSIISRNFRIDFVAAEMRDAERDWWWRSHLSARDVVPRRSFFPVTRLTSRAIDHLLGVRRGHSRRWLRRALWPNDEAFVATTVASADFTSADLNGLGVSFYDATGFGYVTALDPEAVPPDGPARLFHPVLPAVDRLRRAERLRAAAKRSFFRQRLPIAILKRLNQRVKW